MTDCSMPETTTSIPAFKQYIQHQKYIKNVSPRTLAWYVDVERVFGAVDVLNIRPSLQALIQTQLEKGIKPVSVNSWLTARPAWPAPITTSPTVSLIAGNASVGRDACRSVQLRLHSDRRQDL